MVGIGAWAEMPDGQLLRHYGDTTVTRAELSPELEPAVNSDGEVYFRDKRDINLYVFKIDHGSIYFRSAREHNGMWEDEMPAWMLKELFNQ